MSAMNFQSSLTDLLEGVIRRHIAVSGKSLPGAYILLGKFYSWFAAVDKIEFLTIVLRSKVSAGPGLLPGLGA